jgi:hypothetical protein
LIPKFHAIDENLTPQNIGNALYGLKSMRLDRQSKNNEVSHILRFLSTKIRNCNQIFRPQNIAHALYGLKTLTEDHHDVKEVYDIIEGLLTKFSECQEVFSAQQIGSCYYGIQNLQARNPVMKHLLMKLNDAMTRCDISDWNSQVIANIFLGLKSRSCEETEVREILKNIESKLKVITSFTAQGYSNILYSMQNMHSESVEVRSILSVLACKLLEDGGSVVFSEHEISNMIYGLQGMSSSRPEVRLLCVIIILMKNSTYSMSQLN